MIDLSAVQQETNDVSLDLTAKPANMPAAVSPDKLEERAVKYAMALGEASPGVDKVKTLLESPGGEDIIRDTAKNAEERDRRTAAVGVFADGQEDAETTMAAAEASRRPVDRQIALEKRYAERVFATSLALTKDPEEVSTEGAQEVSQVMYDFLVENQTKSEAFRKLLEDRRAKNKADTWGSYLWDSAEQFIPLWSGTSQMNDALGEKMKSWLPGNNKEEQYAYIRGLPAAEAVALVKQIEEEMSASNPLEAEAWLSGLAEGYSGSEAGLENFFFGLDVAGLTPAGLLKKGAIKGGAAALAKKGASARIKAAAEATKNYVAKKELLNNVPTDAQRLKEGWKIVTDTGAPSDAERLKQGWDVGEFLDAPKPVVERLRRTAAVTAQPNAKIDNILAGTGHLEEASHLKAAELAKRTMGGKEVSFTDGVKNLIEQSPMLVHPEQFFIDASKSHFSRAGDLADILKRNENLFADMMAKTVNVSRLPQDVERMALDTAEKQLVLENKQKGMSKALIGAIEKIESQSTGINLAFIEAKYGNKKGTMFPNMKVADNYAKNRYGFIEGTYDVIQEGDGFVIRVRKDIDETSEAVRQALINTENTSNAQRNKILGVLPVPKAVTGAKDTFSKFQNEQRAALTHAYTANAAYANAMVEPIRALSKREIKALSTIMDVNRRTYGTPGDPKTMGQFYKTTGEFEMAYIEHIGRLPTDEETIVYAVFRQQSDMDYVFRSVNELKQKARLGYQKVEADIAGQKVQFEGKEIDSLPFNTRYDAGIYVGVGKKGKYHRANEAGLAETLGKEIKDNNWKIIQVFNPEQNAVKESFGVSGMVNFVVVPNAKKGALRLEEQLPYRPGFHVRYKDEVFVKQGRVQRDSAGRKIYTGDSVALGASNEAKAMKEAGWLERARVAIKNKDDAGLQKVIDEGLPMTKDEVKSLFKTRFSLETPFSVVRNGQNAADPAVRTVNGRSLMDEVGGFEDFSNSPYNDARKLSNEYTGQKDGPLWTIKEGTEENPVSRIEDAPMVDPIQTQMEAMGRLIRDRHYNDYQIGSAESFVKEFGDLLSLDGVNGIDPRDLSRNPLYFLKHGKVRGTGADARTATAKSAQLAINNLLGHRSYISNAVSHFKAKTLNSIYKQFGDKYVQKVDDAFTYLATDIPTKMRAVAFHTKLGLFNPVQFALQSQTHLMISAMAPKHGPQGSMVGALMGRLHLTMDEPKVLDKWASVAAKAVPGWSKEEFKESWNLLKSTGFDIVGREQSYRNDITDPKIFAGKASRMLDASTYFFNGAERWVRLAGWNAAYKEYLEKFPNLAGKLTNNDAKAILSRAQDLTVNMTRDSHAFWQEGDLSMMTQFWGYTARLFDLLTGKRITGAEKARILAVNSAMYGVPMSLGILAPIYPWHEEIRQQLQEAGYNTNAGWLDPMMNGVIASAISGITYLSTGEEIQLDIGGRWGPDAIQMLYNLMDTRRGETGMDELIQLLGGASGTIVSKIVMDAVPVAKDIAYTLSTAGDGTSILMADALNLGKNISSYNTLERAWTAFNLGVYKTKDGRVVDPDYDVFEAAFHAATGIETQDVSDTYLRFMSATEQQEFENKISKEAKRWVRLYFNSDNEEDRREYVEKIKVTLDKGGFRPDQRERIWKDVQKELSLSEAADEAFVKAPNDPAEVQDRQIMIQEEAQ